MSLISYENFRPSLGKDCFVAEGAKLIGQVELGNHVNIWFNCVLRADVHKISIGENTNIQDLSMLHVIEEQALIVGKNVSVGHSVILHACTIEDSCLIGMGAKVLDGAVIGENSVVAAGSVVPPGKTYPPGSMIMGFPAKVVRELTPDEKIKYANHYRSYIGYKNKYLKK